MGYMRHHAIVVTSSLGRRDGRPWIEKAHHEATRLGMSVTPITGEVVNGYRSFLVAPDGSKEGWGESTAGDTRRDAFVNWLRKQAYSDGSSPIDWVEVQYGDDEMWSLTLRDSDDLRRDADACAAEPTTTGAE